MRVGIIFVYVDYHRNGRHHRGVLQPHIGPLIAGLLPADAQVEIVNDTWLDPDWSRDYDLLFLSGMHSDFDRARQISHYWRRRGAKTVYGGTLASTYPDLCQPFFDAIVVGDPEGSVPRLYRDFCRGELGARYVSGPYVADAVPIPRIDLSAQQQVLALGLEATRGCPFSCEFCALTGIGTRHHTRGIDTVLRDIQAGRELLRGKAPWHRRQFIVFYDNNIGGDLRYLRELADGLRPLGLAWGSSITFNAIANAELVKQLSDAGCRFLYVGLESFNPAALADMCKAQNVISKMRAAIRQCHEHGILISSGLMLSPSMDDARYIRSIPRHLSECGLGVPSYICFETPIPGTPHFRRLARETPPAFLPNALLRDFNTYTLVVKPRRETTDDFIASYRWLIDTVYSPRSRLAKCARDAQRFLVRGWLLPVVLDAVDQWSNDYRAEPARSYTAGSEPAPPETVPLTRHDFDSEAEYRDMMAPWRVTDEQGKVLPMWLGSRELYGARGRLARPEIELMDDCAPEPTAGSADLSAPALI